MKILFFSPGYAPAYKFGGPVASITATAEHLVKKGHQVFVFSTNFNLQEDLDVPTDCPIERNGVIVWYFKRRNLISDFQRFLPSFTRSVGFLFTPAMKKMIPKIIPQIDIIHSHLPFVYPTYLAWCTSKIWNKPLFYHQRNNFAPEYLREGWLKKSIYLWAIEKRILRSVTTLIAFNEFEKENYRHLGIENRCRIVPNGIDFQNFRRKPKNPHSSSVLSKIPLDGKLILFLGRIHSCKGADVLLKAFLKIGALHPKAFLVMAGPDEHSLVPEFQKEIEQEGLQDRVIFPGMVSGDEKTDLLARADLFCLPSKSEGFSSAILEALASYTPVLISPGCHFPEVAQFGAGRIVSSTPESFAQGIHELLSAEGKLMEMGEKGRNLVEKDYNWERIIERLVEAYEEGIKDYKQSKS